ncbi:hypothetical protein Pyn_41286 [Prunus yedoensis var. nudiflora]|uniref:Uncharacterized protein n=1 Tax=Prunus yedoensis var. nudiflora TaxID=2094558 RepID=A0A314YYD3_PRUYE|nr:hypothetical protein Pyn_41286 [Prunus yedoensis var. nudiflora]
MLYRDIIIDKKRHPEHTERACGFELEGKIIKARKDRGGGTASYSLRENFRVGEAFGTGSAFISLAETIQSIRGFGEPKSEVFRLDS